MELIRKISLFLADNKNFDILQINIVNNKEI